MSLSQSELSEYNWRANFLESKVPNIAKAGFTCQTTFEKQHPKLLEQHGSCTVFPVSSIFGICIVIFLIELLI